MEIERSKKQYYKKFEIKIEYRQDPKNQLYLTINDSYEILKSELKTLKGIKINVVLKITFAKMDKTDTIYKSAYFQSKALEIINTNEIKKNFTSSF